MKRCVGCLVLLLMLLPVAAMASPGPDDGVYSVEVALEGGSGRASVASPARLTVADGAAVAEVVWSSPYYEHMVVDGTTHYPLRTEGGATFEIPIALDQDIPVRALTVAMSEPHEIEYTLRFDSSTLRLLDGPRSAFRPLAAGAVGALLVLVALALWRRAVRRRP